MKTIKEILKNDGYRVIGFIILFIIIVVLAAIFPKYCILWIILGLLVIYPANKIMLKY